MHLRLASSCSASGKSLRFIEDYIVNAVMPLYANTHSMQSASGKQTIYVREEARAIIKRVCNANEDHALIFTGTGATSAVNLLISKLKLRQICEQVKIANVVESFSNEEDKQSLLAHIGNARGEEQPSHDKGD